MLSPPVSKTNTIKLQILIWWNEHIYTHIYIHYMSFIISIYTSKKKYIYLSISHHTSTGVVSGISRRMIIHRLWFGLTFSPFSSTCTTGVAENRRLIKLVQINEKNIMGNTIRLKICNSISRGNMILCRCDMWPKQKQMFKSQILGGHELKCCSNTQD